jgi:hypothetical protein
MSFDVTSPNLTSGVSNQKKADPTKQAEAKQKFDEEKSAALSAAQGNAALLAQINAISPHKGAIEELETLIAQATNQASSQKSRTIGMA